jgi:hypothetical protein
MDTNYTFKSIIHNLLLDLSPTHLQRSLLVRPRPEHVERILTIVEDRRQHPETAPPLKIVVVGGSVTEGAGCDQGGQIIGRACNWSVRLESFVNNILGFHAIKVYNIASGGTNTGQALSLIKYWMYPDDLGGPPDIIIHAYGANDSNIGHLIPNEVERIQALFTQVLDRLNQFTATVFQSHACPTPIIFHLDDYIGGLSQGGIVGDVTYRIILREVAGWYQNFAVSSARVVSPLIYPDTLGETAFSPPWKYYKGSSKTYQGNCHFGWGGHQAIVWSWAYSFLEVLFNFCDEQDWKAAYKTQEEEIAQDRASLITTQAKELGQVAPPPLDMWLRVEDVSTKWKDQAEIQQQHCNNTLGTENPCAMAWIVGPVGKNIGKTSNEIQPFLTRLEGWVVESKWRIRRSVPNAPVLLTRHPPRLIR